MYRGCLMMILMCTYGLTLAQVCDPAACKGPNLVFDGNFESVTDPNNPSLNFSTDFGYANCPPATPQDLWGNISVRREPGNCYYTWTGYDHTIGDSSGRMLLVDFPDVNPGNYLDIWNQTITVEPGATYCFGAWYRNLNVGVSLPRPNFRYLVDGVLIGTSANLSNNGNWIYYGFSYTIPSGLTQVEIAIQNGKFGGNGNDLAVDDIEFRKLLSPGTPPDAINDNVYLPAGAGPIAIPVLANDVSNVPGASLDPSMLSILSWPAAAEGSISVGTNGVIDFTPAPGFAGISSFSYEICNPAACCSQAVVSVSVDYVLSAQVDQFQVYQEGEGATLSWLTPANSQLAKFEIERSHTRLDFTSIGTVEVSGSHELPAYYQFQDQDIQQDHFDKLHYRLRQTDLNGRVSVSSIVELDLQTNSPIRYSIYPNPVVDGVLNLRYQSIDNSDLEFRLFTLNGQQVHRQTLISHSSDNHTRIDVSDLPRGLYMLSLGNGSTEIKERIAILN